MTRARMSDLEVDDLLAQVENLLLAIDRAELSSGSSVVSMLQGARIALLAVVGSPEIVAGETRPDARNTH